MRRSVSLVLLWLYAACAAAQADPSIVQRLREGGYILFVRHASTDFSQNDARMTSFEDCASQRNLTEKGRAEARALGEQVNRLKIPIGEVRASPFCRTMETAQLAFGKAQATPEARGGQVDDRQRHEPLRQLLSSRPWPRQNDVVVSHGNPFYALFGPPYLAEGEIAVLKPDAPSGVAIVGRIRLGDWQAFH